MNVFITDLNPIKAAQSLCDCHVVKMCLETTQLLSTHVQCLGHSHAGMYKPTHQNHPCRKALNEMQYLRWVCEHGVALFDEYHFRYGKQHKSRPVFNAAYLKLLDLRCLAPVAGIEWAPQCMPPDYRGQDTVAAYRAYYHEKATTLSRFAYTRREQPEWLWTEVLA